jgi:hypothetical protein
MIQKKKYVRKLIRKKIMGTLTAEEESRRRHLSTVYALADWLGGGK